MKLSEIFNSIFDLHDDPKNLKHYDNRLDVPDVALNVIKKHLASAHTLKNLDQLISTVAKDPLCAYRYAQMINDRFEEGEKAIATLPMESYLYAYKILRGPFKEGEKAIATDADYSMSYARDVLSGHRFKLGEKVIAANPIYAALYARNIIGGPFKEGEKAIASEPVAREWYNYDIKKWNRINRETGLNGGKQYDTI